MSHPGYRGDFGSSLRSLLFFFENGVGTIAGSDLRGLVRVHHLSCTFILWAHLAMEKISALNPSHTHTLPNSEARTWGVISGRPRNRNLETRYVTRKVAVALECPRRGWKGTHGSQRGRWMPSLPLLPFRGQ